MAGRGAFVTLLPVGLTLLGVWAVLGPDRVVAAPPDVTLLLNSRVRV